LNEPRRVALGSRPLAALPLPLLEPEAVACVASLSRDGAASVV